MTLTDIYNRDPLTLTRDDLRPLVETLRKARKEGALAEHAGKPKRAAGKQPKAKTDDLEF